MKIHELTDLQKRKSIKRVGRGIAAGQGKTAGRGTKGQNSRAGHSHRPDFEGGQTPLMMRLPKLGGFRSVRPKVQNVYTGQLNDFAGKTADNASLAAAGLVTNPYEIVKIVVKGELTAKVTVSVQGASSGAKAQIEKAGGTFTKVDRVKRPASSKNEVAEPKVAKKPATPKANK